MTAQLWSVQMPDTSRLSTNIGARKLTRAVLAARLSGRLSTRGRSARPSTGSLASRLPASDTGPAAGLPMTQQTKGRRLQSADPLTEVPAAPSRATLHCLQGSLHRRCRTSARLQTLLPLGLPAPQHPGRPRSSPCVGSCVASKPGHQQLKEPLTALMTMRCDSSVQPGHMLFSLDGGAAAAATATLRIGQAAASSTQSGG